MSEFAYSMKLEGIEGSSDLADKEVNIKEFSYDISAAPRDVDRVSGALKPGLPRVSPVRVFKLMCSATPVLMKCIATGKEIDKVTLTEYTTSGEAGKKEKYQVLTLENVYITMHTVANGGFETLELDPIVVTHEFFKRDEKTNIVSSAGSAMFNRLSRVFENSSGG
ncbi:type VI secretion system tube protein Hcp [Bordetella genomosp. 9]|uniref:Hcp1 family type VI secretion system effector n=1 Tax=Bordetella genomosp. 9 TaxID=1416803 RepID=A0A1W6YX71_9BORD|nr:type VI secretion system tube protein Hcp [Bordetella genomosp. 9]ARP85564.1 hypothetical protein CAL13_04545 [Bordetella genomosp. 9]